MNKERLASEAETQYSRLRGHSETRDSWENMEIKPDPYRSERERRSINRHRWDEIDYHERMMGFFKSDSRKLYEEHHAELYDLAREEMEADGVAFSEGDPYKVTEYYHGKEIADLERRAKNLEQEGRPIDALGVNIVLIGKLHVQLVEEELGQRKPGGVTEKLNDLR